MFLGFGQESLNDTSVTSEVSRKRELTKAMSDHVFGDENVFEDLAVVDQKSEADEFWGDL